MPVDVKTDFTSAALIVMPVIDTVKLLPNAPVNMASMFAGLI